MRAVYEYCEAGGAPPLELEGGFMIEKFGAPSVYGRVLRVGEMRILNAARSVWDAWHSRTLYRDRDGDKNFAEWAERNPKMNDVLNEARTNG